MVEAADMRGRVERPNGDWLPLEVLPGAFTLWNMQAEAAVEITAELLDIAAAPSGRWRRRRRTRSTATIGGSARSHMGFLTLAGTRVG
jgi:hypothetical protein